MQIANINFSLLLSPCIYIKHYLQPPSPYTPPPPHNPKIHYLRFLEPRSDLVWSHFEKQSEAERQIEKLGYHLVFEKNKYNNHLMDQLIKKKSQNMKLFNKKKIVNSKVESILQYNYEEINILKKEKRRLFQICEDEQAKLSRL